MVTGELAEELGFLVWNTGQWYLVDKRGNSCDLPNAKRDLLISLGLELIVARERILELEKGSGE